LNHAILEEENRMLSFGFVVAALSATAGACQVSLPGSSSAEPLVAKGNGVAITASEFKARAEETPPAVRAGLASPGARRSLLDQLLLFRLTARAAEAEGMKRRTNDVAGERRLVAEFLQKKFNDPRGAEQIPDADVRKYYEEHKDEYVKPVRIRFWQLFVAAPEESPARAMKGAQAKKLQERILAAERSDPEAFARISAEVLADTKSGVTGGLLGLRSKADLVRDFSPKIAESLFRKWFLL
jgi:peptidyl-prolyl cis-trans isomerase C